MTTERVTSAMAQSFLLATTYAASVTDSAGTNVRTFNPSGSNYYRTFLGPVSGAGTLASPKEFLGYVESVLVAARWTVDMTAQARVKITAIGTGTSSITWTDPLIRNLLGFTGNTGSLTQGQSITATNPPTHFLAIMAATNDTGWVPEDAGIAGVELPDGDVDMIGDDIAKMRRSYTIRMSPRIPGSAPNSNSTPMFPLESSATGVSTTDRWKYPSPDPTRYPGTTATVWSVHEFICTAKTPYQRVAISHGEFEALVAGTATLYDLCSFTAATRKSKVTPSVPSWSARADRGIEVLLRQRESVA